MRQFVGLNSIPTGGSGSRELPLSCSVDRNCSNNSVSVDFTFSAYISDHTFNLCGGSFSYSISGLDTSKVESSSVTLDPSGDDYGAIFMNGEKVAQVWHYLNNPCGNYAGLEDCENFTDTLEAINYLNTTVGFGSWDAGGSFGIGGHIRLYFKGIGTNTSWFENFKITLN